MSKERLTAKKIFDNYYDCLTQFERDTYTTSDRVFDDITFDSVDDFKEFCAGFKVAMKWKKGDIIYNHEKRQNICRELLRYGKIIIDVQYEKNCKYFRKIIIKCDKFIYEIHLINGICTKIKNLLT